MAKKRKLNSKNPKYIKLSENEIIKERRVLMCSGPNKNTNVHFKVYSVFKEN